MNTVIGHFSRLVTARPWITIAMLLMVTVVLGYGTTYREPPTEGASLAFLPPNHPLGDAAEDIEEHFGDSGEIIAGNIVFRGETLAPDGLAQMDALLADIASDPVIVDVLTPADPIFFPSSLFKAVLQVNDLGTVTQAQIDSVRNAPGIGETLGAVTGTDVDGTQVAVGSFQLINTADNRVIVAQERINELALDSEGPLSASSLSPRIIEAAYQKATEEGMAPLMMLALVLIAVLLLVFTRSPADMLLSLAGLVISILDRAWRDGWGRQRWGLIATTHALSRLSSAHVDLQSNVSHYRAGPRKPFAGRRSECEMSHPLWAAVTRWRMFAYASRPIESWRTSCVADWESESAD